DRIGEERVAEAEQELVEELLRRIAEPRRLLAGRDADVRGLGIAEQPVADPVGRTQGEHVEHAAPDRDLLDVERDPRRVDRLVEVERLARPLPETAEVAADVEGGEQVLFGPGEFHASEMLAAALVEA